MGGGGGWQASFGRKKPNIRRPRAHQESGE